MRLRFLPPALTLALAAAPASACSLAGPYRIPNNLQLAERADTILLGTVERQEGGPPGDTFVIVRPTVLLKGRALPDEVRLSGGLAGPGEPVTRSDPREISRPNPDVTLGACNRDAFLPGMQLVLFLARDRKGVLQPYVPPFARAAEDVPSADALWVKAVRLYAEASLLPARARRAFLAGRRAAALAAGDPESRLLAADIDRQLKGKEPSLLP